MKILSKYKTYTFRYDVLMDRDKTIIKDGIVITVRKLYDVIEVSIFENGNIVRMDLEAAPGEINRTQASIISRKVFENYKRLKQDLRGVKYE